MIVLFPRLPRAVAFALASDHATATVLDLASSARLEHESISYAPTGGRLASEHELAVLADGLRERARSCGYPGMRARGANDDFDALAGRFLHEQSGLTLTEACRDEVWNFIGCLMAPDVVRWRFPGELTNPEHFLGRDRGIDSALGRCWWAAELLNDEQAAEEPYHLLSELGVDEIVGFSRRVNVVVNRRVAVGLARSALWVEAASHLPFPRLDLSRDLMKRFLRLSTIVSFETLGSDELEASTRRIALESARALCAARGLDFSEPRAESFLMDGGRAAVDPLSALISGISLSSRSVSRFDEVKAWFESELLLERGTVAVKYLSDAKNYRNRIGEALRQRPAVLVLLYTEGAEPDIIDAFADRIALSPSSIVLICTRRNGAVWKVVTVGGAHTSPLTTIIQDRFKGVDVKLIESQGITTDVDVDELRQQLEEGFEDLFQEANDLMDVSVSALIQSCLKVPPTSVRGKHVSDAKNLGNRISEAIGTGCSAVVVSVADSIADDALRILQAQLDSLGHFVVGAVLPKAAGNWSRPAQLVLPRQQCPPSHSSLDIRSAPPDGYLPKGEHSGIGGDLTLASCPDLETRYQRLLTRLRNVTSQEPTLGSILGLSSSWFRAQRGVGSKYVSELERLQGEIRERFPGTVVAGDETAQSVVDETPSLPDAAVSFNYRFLSYEERRAHAKFEQLLGREATVSDYLEYSAAEHANQPGVGRKTLRSLEQIQRRVTTAIRESARDDFSPFRAGLLVFEMPDLIELAVAGEIIREDLDAILESAVERDAKVFRVRVGYGEAVRTMASLGLELGISRERVRQIENKLVEEVRRSTRIHPNALRLLVVDSTHDEMLDEMATLSQGFDGNAEFFSFVESFCGLERGALLGSRRYDPPARPSDVNALFAVNASPICRKSFAELIESELGVPMADTQFFVGWLQREGRIAVEDDDVVPCALTKAQAVAHVLLAEPEGLPFQEIAARINSRKLTRAQIDTTRSGAYLTDSPWFYVCGQGTYRHVEFFPLGDREAEELLTLIRSDLENFGVESENLQQIHSRMKMPVEYFDLRYLVSRRGEDFGLFFTGASRVDTVGLHPDAERVTVQETIFRMIENAEESLPIEAIVGALRSEGVARDAVGRLLEDGRVIFVDGGYRATEQVLTPEVASRLTLLINDVLREPGLPVLDADVVRERANVELGLNRGRDFYVSAIRALSVEGGWTVRRSLLSRADIPWSSLSDLVRESVEACDDNDEAVSFVRSRIRITDAAVRSAVRNALGTFRWQAS